MIEKLKPLLKIIFGPPHRKIASLLIAVGAGLVGQDLIILILEAGLAITVPTLPPLTSYIIMGVGALCILAGIFTFFYFEREDYIQPAKKGYSITVPDGLPFTSVYTLIARELGLGISFAGFTAEEKNTLISEFTVTNIEIDKLSTFLSPYVRSSSFPKYNTQSRDETLIVSKDG